jgi:hypothetical protein
MCTSVVEIVGVDGAGVSESGWFPVTSAVVSYDHPHHALLEDAITIDFVNANLGPAARAAVEITLESAKQLVGALTRAIAAAEEMEDGRGLQEQVESRKSKGTQTLTTPASLEPPLLMRGGE